MTLESSMVAAEPKFGYGVLEVGKLRRMRAKFKVTV